jgi:hypothetical protein
MRTQIRFFCKRNQASSLLTCTEVLWVYKSCKTTHNCTERAILWLSRKCEKWPINSQTINTNHKTTITTLSSEGGMRNYKEVELCNERHCRNKGKRGRGGYVIQESTDQRLSTQTELWLQPNYYTLTGLNLTKLETKQTKLIIQLCEVRRKSQPLMWGGIQTWGQLSIWAALYRAGARLCSVHRPLKGVSNRSLASNEPSFMFLLYFNSNFKSTLRNWRLSLFPVLGKGQQASINACTQL